MIDEEKLTNKAMKICKENNWSFISQVGRTGAESCCYLVEIDGKEYVLKVPVDENNDYKEKQEKVQKATELLANYKGKVLIPKTEFKNGFCIEQFMGEDLNLSDLSDKQVEEFASELGEFLAHLHNQTKTKNKSSYSILKESCANLKQMKERYMLEMDKEYKQFIERLFDEVKKYNTDDEFEAWCHADIRCQNILFDKKSQTISVIDYDCLSLCNIYSDFIAKAPASQHFTPEFLNIMIDSHNNNSIYQIDKSKFVAIYKLGILDEYARVAMLRNKTPKEFMKVLKDVKYIENCERLDDVLLADNLNC